MNENVIKAALLGFGTVGTGVYKVLKNQEKEMSAKIGCKVEIKKIEDGDRRNRNSGLLL